MTNLVNGGGKTLMMSANKDLLVRDSSSKLAYWRAVAGVRHGQRDACPRQAGHLRRHVPNLQSHLGASFASIIASGTLDVRITSSLYSRADWRAIWAGEPSGGHHERSVGLGHWVCCKRVFATLLNFVFHELVVQVTDSC
jgi:hypothetical protein